jgi:hypothetical protein
VALLCKIKEWNQEPSCAAKVKIIFNQLGLHPPSDVRMLAPSRDKKTDSANVALRVYSFRTS